MPESARRSGPALQAHFQFLLWLIPAVEKFPRSKKFLLGDRIQTIALDVLEALIEATYTRDGKDHLARASKRRCETRKRSMAKHLANRRAPEAPSQDLGPDNLYAGMPDADERLLKATLVARVRAVIADRGLTQVKAGEIMGVPQPKVSELVSRGAAGFSAERLIHLLNKLGISVSIALREETDWSPGTTYVHFDREPDADMVAPDHDGEPVESVR